MKQDYNEYIPLNNKSESELKENSKEYIIRSDRLIFITKSFSHELPGIIVEANEKACRLLGYSKEDLLSMSFYDLVDIQDVGILEKKVKKLTENEYLKYNLNVYTKKGRKIKLRFESFLLSAHGGNTHEHHTGVIVLPTPDLKSGTTSHLAAHSSEILRTVPRQITFSKEHYVRI